MYAKEEIMKTVQDIIFSKDFELGMDGAVARAVARADSAGLPKAYLDSYSNLPDLKPINAEKARKEFGN